MSEATQISRPVSISGTIVSFSVNVISEVYMCMSDFFKLLSFDI